ncbi:2-hydroxyacid dehydrogenase [Brevibacillus sp. NRS-1366]|uniref:2-hydroxyacid dehydrogenase n=1 Tax=Brevibacillus sp. NRS-1366 TaxID=3233899 RepID=UPI003D20CAB7
MEALVTAELDLSLLEQLKECCEVTMAGWAENLQLLPENELIELLKGKQIVITSYDEVTKRVIDACEDLRLIACTRSSPVNIDIEAATLREIPVIYTPGRNADCAAEYTIGMMLGIARNIPMAYKSLKEGHFVSEQQTEKITKEGLKEDVTWALSAESPYVLFKGFRLKGKTLGLIGLGSIGKKVATLAKAFGMNICVFDPYVPQKEMEDVDAKKVELETLLRESDFISCHAKVTRETTRLIGEQEFRMMKPTAYFINTSRGAIMDERALIHALKTKTIAGAALDVFESEPLSIEHPFIQELDNIVVTPHLGGATYDAITNHTTIIIEEIRRFVAGEKLLFQINPFGEDAK